MSIDQILEAVEQVLLSRQLNPLERLVLHQSWNGRTYMEMARESGYDSVYIKEVGSQLWQELSEALGERVTKKNLRLLLNPYQIQKPPEKDLQNTPDDRLDSTIGKEIEFPSGPVPLDSPLYIKRPPIEEQALAEIAQPGGAIRIKAPRKMGKSSLLNRIVAQADAWGYQTAYLDFQDADKAVFGSLDRGLRWFCANISRQLRLNARLDDYWDAEMGSKVSCKLYFEEYLLEQIDRPLLLALNDVHRILEHPNVAQDFLTMLQSWHERARAVTTWQKLRLAIVQTTEIYSSLDRDRIPVSIGRSIVLPEFSLEQVQELAICYGLDWVGGESGAQALAPLMAMVGGHPYLMSIALYHLARLPKTPAMEGGKWQALEELLQAAPTPGGIYSGHLREHLALLRGDPQLASALQQVVTAAGSVRLDAIAAYQLESLGLVQIDGDEVMLSCQLYRQYFSKQLEREADSSQPPPPKPENPKLYRLYSLDRLTQLPNREGFDRALEKEWRRLARQGESLSAIVCCIDDFQAYNDRFGTPAGDDCLQQVAGAIREEVHRPADMVARYGGVKFALMLPQTESPGALCVAEQIRQRVRALAIASDPFGRGSSRERVLTLSVGVVSTVPNFLTSPAKLVAAAREALEFSKTQGGDRVTLSQWTADKGQCSASSV